MKSTHNNLQTLQDKDLILTLGNNTRGGLSGVMGDRYVKPDENKKMIYMDATNLYGHSMSQKLPYVEIERWYGHRDLYMNKLDENINTPDDSDFGYFIEVDLKYPNNIKVKTKNSPFSPENKIIDKKIIMIV